MPIDAVSSVALRVLQIIALLLPLTIAFFQFALRVEDGGALQITDDMMTAIGAASYFMAISALFAIFELLIRNTQDGIRAALLALVIAFGAVGYVGVKLPMEFTDTTPEPAIRRVAPKAYTQQEQSHYETLSEEAQSDKGG